MTLVLEIFNSENCISAPTSVKIPAITFSKVGGQVRLSPSARALLKLKLGDKISFAFDQNNRLYAFLDEKGFVLREIGTGKFSSLGFTNITLKGMVRQKLKLSFQEGQQFEISYNPVTNPKTGHFLYELKLKEKGGSK